MRVNVKKLTIITVTLVVLWIVVSYLSMIEVPGTLKPSPENIVELENKIDQLQKQLHAQVYESKLLLKQVKKFQKTEDEAAKEDSLEVNKNEHAKSTPTLPVLVISCDRITVKRCLDNLTRFRPNKQTFPIIVSQDCGHNATYQVIKSFTERDPTITVVRQPDLSEIPMPPSNAKFKGYYKIARHYKFALNYVFKELRHQAVIIIEDDLDVSPDIYEYFLGTYPLLLRDRSIWCISAWNDNGKKNLIDVSKPELLYRTDFFPGLGWLLRRESWMKLEPKWPAAYFDDWLRNPINTEGRVCIRPEISRTFSFGKKGVSQGLYYDNHLRHMRLNEDYVEFTKLNLTYLLKENYDKSFNELVYSLPEMSADEAMTSPVIKDTPVRVPYSSAKSFQKAAKKLGLMDDFRSGVPRAAYHGVVTCYVRGRRVYLAPDYEWVKYDPQWGKV